MKHSNILFLLSKDNYPTFRLTAKHWATSYAGAKHANPEYDNLLSQLKGQLQLLLEQLLVEIKMFKI